MATIFRCFGCGVETWVSASEAGHAAQLFGEKNHLELLRGTVGSGPPSFTVQKFTTDLGYTSLSRVAVSYGTDGRTHMYRWNEAGDKKAVHQKIGEAH